MSEITPKQREMLEWIKDFQHRNRRSPSTADACNRFGYSSKNSAHKLWMKLKEKGALEFDRNGRIKFEDHSLDELRKAWLDKGPQPKYHDDMKERLFRRWPKLAQAIDNLVGK